MRIIMEEYGGIILTGVTVILLLGLMFFSFFWSGGRGILSALRGGASIPMRVEAEESLDILESHLGYGTPEIVAPSGVRTEISYDASELFSMNSPEELHVRILKVWKDGEEIGDEILEGEQIHFPEEGIYRLRIWVEDVEKHSGVEEIYVGVNP